jgi:hypothetical protein
MNGVKAMTAEEDRKQQQEELAQARAVGSGGSKGFSDLEIAEKAFSIWEESVRLGGPYFGQAADDWDEAQKALNQS